MSRCVSFFALIVLVGGCANDSSSITTDPLANLPSICLEASAPDGCGESCETASSCDAGTFCRDGLCDAVCTPQGGECGSAGSCSSTGRCVPFTDDGGAPTGDGSVCGTLVVDTDRVIPNIMLIVDRSGSMRHDFDDDEPGEDGFDPNAVRWDAVEEALVGDDGLVRRLDSIARFGLTLYWKPSQPRSERLADGAMCASTEEVPFSASLENAGPISTLFAQNPPQEGLWTPTAEAIESVTAAVLASPPPEGPIVYLLATDGLPNGCDQDHEAEDRDNSVAAVAAAFGEGIETFVLGVAFDDDHLQDLANAGLGVDSDATLWTAADVSELESALAQIVEQNIPCTVNLTDGTIDTAQACQGQVTLSGEVLTCEDSDRGWRAVDGQTIELLGSACTDWRRGDAELNAAFPCFVVVQ